MKPLEIDHHQRGQALRAEAIGVMAYVRVEEQNDSGGIDRCSTGLSRDEAIRLAAWLLAWATDLRTP